MEVLGCGLYSLMDRSADPARMYVPGDAEYVSAWTGPVVGIPVSKDSKAAFAEKAGIGKGEVRRTIRP